MDFVRPRQGNMRSIRLVDQIQPGYPDPPKIISQWKLLGLSCVYFTSRDRTFLTLSISLRLFLLLFFPSFLGRLKTLGTSLCFYTSDLRFFCLGVFHGTALALGNGRVGWLIALETVLIYFFSAGARPESRLGLGVNGLLNNLIEVF